MIKNKTLKFEDDNIIVSNDIFTDIRGLFKLFFMANPNEFHNEEDLDNYKKNSSFEQCSLAWTRF